LLDNLREFEANPDLCSEDPEMQAARLPVFRALLKSIEEPVVIVKLLQVCK